VLRESFDVVRGLSRVTQSFPNLPDCLVYTHVEVDEGLTGPQPFPQFLPCDHPARPPQEHGEDFEGLLLKLDLDAVPAQFPGRRLQLEGAEAEDPR